MKKVKVSKIIVERGYSKCFYFPKFLNGVEIKTINLRKLIPGKLKKKEVKVYEIKIRRIGGTKSEKTSKIKIYGCNTCDVFCTHLFPSFLNSVNICTDNLRRLLPERHIRRGETRTYKVKIKEV